MTEHKDFLGNEYAEGDSIIYAAMSGRSVTMVAARVIKFNDSGSVTVQPLKSSRWEQHTTKRTRYIDKRTGKGIDPYAPSGKHTEQEAYVTDKRTGERIPEENLKAFIGGGYMPWKFGTDNPNFVPHEFREYHPTVYMDYVKQVIEDGAKPVTLTITKNIVKWVSPVDVDHEG